MNMEQTEQLNKEILTIEKVLGPDSDYNQIIVDLKDLLSRHEGVVVSDFEEAGISATNAYRAVTGGGPFNPAEYKTIHQQWLDFMKKKNIQVPARVLGRFLYCRGEKELAKQIDLGHGAMAQSNPEEYVKNTICPN